MEGGGGGGGGGRGRRGGRDDFFGFGDAFPRFGVGRDPFDDPFFTRPLGSLMGPSIFGRRMFGETTDAQFLGEAPTESGGGPVIRELSDDDDDGGEQKPVVQEPDEETKETKNLHVQYGGEFNRASVAQPQARTYAFRSSTVTYGGPNGAYYTSSTTRRTSGDGITVEESKEADATTGRAAHRISRGIRDKGHSVTRRLGSDGRVDTTQKLHNLNEDELAGFEEAWRGNARQHLPGWNPGFDMLDSNNSRSHSSTEEIKIEQQDGHFQQQSKHTISGGWDQVHAAVLPKDESEQLLLNEHRMVYQFPATTDSMLHALNAFLFKSYSFANSPVYSFKR